jgi:hypothetical protein
MLDAARQPWALPRWAVIADARRRQRRRQRRVLALIVAMLLTAAAGWQIVSHSQSGPAPASPPAVVGSVQRVLVDGTPLDATTLGANLWVLTCLRFSPDGTTCGAGDLSEIRDAGGRVLKRTRVDHPSALASGDGAIWITHQTTDQVARIDPRTGQTTATIHLRLAHPITTNGWRRFVPSAISFGAGRIWVSSGFGFLAEINPRTARLTRIVTTGSEATSTATAHGLTWVADELDGVGTFTPGSTRVAHHQISWAGQPLDITTIAHGAGLIWTQGWQSSLTDPKAEISVVTTIDPQTGRIVHQWPVMSVVAGPLPPGAVLSVASTMLVTDSAAYVTGSSDRQLLRLTPPQRSQPLLVPKIAELAAATPHALWVTTQNGQLLRIGLTQR